MCYNDIVVLSDLNYLLVKVKIYCESRVSV